MTDRLDAAVDAALDAGRDPLDDAAVLDALVDEPERFDAVAQLAHDARALASVAPRPRILRRNAIATAIAAAALLAVGPVFVSLLTANGAPVPDQGGANERDAGATQVARSGGTDADAATDTNGNGAGSNDANSLVASSNLANRVAPPASGVDELRVEIRSGPWRPNHVNTGADPALAPRPASTVLLTRGRSTGTTILRTVGGVAPDGSRTTFTYTENLR